jgi:hypothetical protein
MRTLRLLAGLGVAAALTTAAPAFAGGGAGMTVTASMSGQGGLVPYGSPHAVWVQVTDSTLGEATLEHVTVTVTVNVTGVVVPVTCDRGPNGTVQLVPGLTLDCSTQITAAAGPQTITVQAAGVVAGGDSKLVKTVVVTYQGSVPTPAPPAPAAASSSPQPVVVRPPAISTLGSGAPKSAAPSAGCAPSSTNVVNGSACTPSAMPSMACMPSPSPGAGTGPESAAGSGCAPMVPTASPAAGCAANGIWPGAPGTPGSVDCAKASDRGILALTGTQIMLWGAVAMTALASGVGLMLRHRRTAGR